MRNCVPAGMKHPLASTLSAVALATAWPAHADLAERSGASVAMQSAQVPGDQAIARAATSISGAPGDYDPLVRAAADADIVLLGDASHGTADVYRERARISERLLREGGFGAIALEADGPQVERIDRFVRGLGIDRTVAEALGDLRRFPRWMWRNREFAEFLERLRAHNAAAPQSRRVGVYGLDVCALFEAADRVVAYLAPGGSCGSPARLGPLPLPCALSPQRTGYGEANRHPGHSCAADVQAAFALVQAQPRPAAGDDPLTGEAQFKALRNAQTAVGAEAYARAVYAGAYAWNVRERSMAEGVRAIADHLGQASPFSGRVIVWTHNLHAQDGRATDMPRRGEVSLGQLLRGEPPRRVFSVGFLIGGGRVLAASSWGAPAQPIELPAPLPRSVEAVLWRSGLARSLLLSRDAPSLDLLQQPRLQRAVGAVYRPRREPAASYQEAVLARQFDAVIYLDRTTPLTPLDVDVGNHVAGRVR